ncbi:unnamed protein product [Adineta ricciae]|uniref:Uncharacterized protein n=1 Tax=Adineta ricciae TaxID=249248 RepID=A0A814NUD5_ADIRI|nr:unnamed protein product [Adineta ricciae]CAF1406643.1 unnamed protein product [Adineta ricciae]
MTSTIDHSSENVSHINVRFGGTSHSLDVEPPPSSNPLQMEHTHDGQIPEETSITSTAISCEEQKHTQPPEETHPVDVDVPSASNEIEIDSQVSPEPSLDGHLLANTSEQNETVQNVANEQINCNEQSVNMYEDARYILGHLHGMIEDMKPILTSLPSYIEDREHALQQPVSFPTDFETKLEIPVRTLMDVFRHIAEIMRENNQTQNATLDAKQTNETAEKRVSAPSEENHGQLNEQFQTTTDVSPSTVPKPSLSELLSNLLPIPSGKILSKLELKEEPLEFLKARYIKCLSKGERTPIHSENNLKGLTVTWSELTKHDAKSLYIVAQLLSYDGKPHPTKVLIPPETTIKPECLENNTRPSLSDLVISAEYGYNPNNQSILYRVTDEEYNKCEKTLEMYVFNRYQCDNTIDNTIEKQVHKLCRLLVCICCLTKEQTLEQISGVIHSSWIEESKGTKRLAVLEEEISPKKLCRCGRDIIQVPLNTESEKNGLLVEVDGQPLKFHEFRGVTHKRIQIPSRPYVEMRSLHLTVLKESVLETVKLGKNPYESTSLEKLQLLDTDIDYADAETACGHRQS